MQNFYYAEINEEKICIAISILAGKIEAEHMIEIEEYSSHYMNRKYENGKWSEEKFISEPIKTLELERQRYIRLIQEAQILGETEEVERFQTEWKQVKLQFES